MNSQHPTSQTACLYCRHWAPEPHHKTGECRRLPPVRIQVEFGDDSAWPPTGQGDWCGEFAHRQTSELLSMAQAARLEAGFDIDPPVRRAP